MTSKVSNQPSVSYAYSYQDHPPDSDSDSLVIKLSCPVLSSCVWCVQLYCLVLATLGTLLSTIWVIFHTYVLSHTTLEELRHQRYLDIFLGLLLLVSMLSLLYGSYSRSSIFIIVSLASSCCVVVVYWSWFCYTKYADTDYPVFQEQVGEIGFILTILYIILILPTVVLYRSLEVQQTSTTAREMDKINVQKKHPPLYKDGSGWPSV